MKTRISLLLPCFFFTLLIFPIAEAPPMARKSVVLNPEPWCKAPDIGGGNIYSPFILRHRTGYRMYFGGWYESCRIVDTIYVASYDAKYGYATNVQKIFFPEDIGFLGANDPVIVSLLDTKTGFRFLLMYMTAAEEGDILPKIYVSTSWANDGINWSIPFALLDGWWVPAAAVHPITGNVWLWANSTITGEFRAFEFAPNGVTLLNSYPTILSPGANYANADVRWNFSLNGWDIIAQNINRADIPVERLYSADGTIWEKVDANFIPLEPDYFNITPAWAPYKSVLFGHYWKGWPPDSEHFMSIWRWRIS